jgi:hypothetical protein
LDGIQWRIVERLFRERQRRYYGGIALQVLNREAALDPCIPSAKVRAFIDFLGQRFEPTGGRRYGGRFVESSLTDARYVLLQQIERGGQ